MKWIKKYYFLGLIFFFFLIWNLIINPLNLDEIWNYGFTRNIFLGEIPYKDFNMVITPFYPFLMSILMHIFGYNMLFFHIENALLITILFYYCYQLIGKNIWLIILFMIWPITISFPNYNLFSLLLVIMILYYEKQDNKDHLIGLFLGLLILTKQSIGLPILLVSILIEKDNKKRVKRLLFALIPLLLFLIELLITKSLKQFIDLCILGIFDFQKTNHNYQNPVFFISILFLLLSFLLLKKEKERDYYYGISFITMTIPIFDYYHFMLYFVLFIIVFLEKQKEKKWISLEKIAFVIVLLISLTTMNWEGDYPNQIPHFEYRYLNKEYIRNTEEVNSYIEKYNHKVIIIGPDSYYHKIIFNQTIGYLDLMNTGNWGLNGTEKLLKAVKEVDKDYYFFINRNEIFSKTQTDQNIIKYIQQEGQLIEKTKFYDIYQIK